MILVPGGILTTRDQSVSRQGALQASFLMVMNCLACPMLKGPCSFDPKAGHQYCYNVLALLMKWYVSKTTLQ